MNIIVESDPDQRGVYLPRRIQFDGRAVDVVEIVDQWPGRDYVYFKVKGDDTNIYILRLDETDATWELTMFDAPQVRETASYLGGRERRGDGAA